MLHVADPLNIWGQAYSILFCPLSTSSAYQIILRVLRAFWMLICYARRYCQFQRACRFLVADVWVWCMKYKGVSRVWRPCIRRLFRIQRMIIPHYWLFGRGILWGRYVFIVFPSYVIDGGCSTSCLGDDKELCLWDYFEDNVTGVIANDGVGIGM